MKPLMLVSRVELVWGFSVRYAGASAAQPALPVPPPTTIVGFYAEPLARLLGIPEYTKTGKKGTCSVASLLAEHVLAAGAGLDPESPSGLIVYSDLAHVASLIYQRRRTEWKKFAFSAQAVGAAYGPAARLYIALVVDVEGLAASLGESTRTLADALAWAGWRLGSKEGVVAVVDAEAVKPATSSGVFESLLYQDSELVEPSARTDLVRTINMWGLDPRLLCGETAIPAYKSYYMPASATSTSTLLVPPPKSPLPEFMPRNARVVYCHPGQRALCIASS